MQALAGVPCPPRRRHFVWRCVAIGKTYSVRLIVVADFGGMERAGFEVYWDAVTFKPLQFIAGALEGTQGGGVIAVADFCGLDIGRARRVKEAVLLQLIKVFLDSSH